MGRMRQVGVVGWLGEQHCFFVKHICEVNKMAQSKIDVSGMTSKQDGDRLVEATSNVAGVKFVNANHEGGYVVVTHGDDFDAAAYKAAVNAAGFSA